MIEEFAIDPECFADSEIFHILRECGFSKGRVVCEFPRKHWGASIRDLLRSRNISEIEQSRIVALLEKLKLQDKAIVRRISTGNELEMSWLGKACVEHGKHPFKGILSTSNPESKAFVIELSKAWEGGSAWSVKKSIKVPMSAPEFAKRICPLLRYSETVRFIDSYMSATKEEALRGIGLALKCAARNRSIGDRLKVEIHLRFEVARRFKDANKESDKKAQEVERQARIECEFNNLVAKAEKFSVFPDGTDVTFIAWPELITDEMKFHNRHVLTERGGITFGSSLDVGGKIDQAHLLEEDDHEFFWRSFTAPDRIPCAESKVLRKYSFKV